MIELFIAGRHIKERKRQSLLAMLGVAIGICVMIVSIAIANGLNKEMVDNILSMTAHITGETSEVSIYNYMDKKKLIEGIEGVRGATPVYSTQGIIKYEEGKKGTFVQGVRIAGIEKTSIKEVLKMDEKIVEGSLNFEELKSIILGKELADQIGAEIGTQIKVISPENKEMKLKITGIYKSGYYDFDSTLIIVPLKTIQFLSNSNDVATGIDVMIDDPYEAEKIAKVIRQKTNLLTKTWGQKNENLLKALALEKTVMVLVFSLIVLISAFVIAVILNMMVREKTKDVGILRSIGYSKAIVMRVFLIEGIILGVTGAFLGLTIAMILTKILEKYSFDFISNIYYLTKIPVEISFTEVLMILISTIGVIILASLFPAYKASKLIPVEALKYE